MLNLNYVTKKFQDTPVLEHVNLDIPEGSVFGLIGPNGSGKTTLLKVIAGIIKPDLGSASIDHVNIFDNPEGKRQILLISDDPFYFFQSTLKEMKEFYKLWYPSLDEAVYQKYLAIFQLDEKKMIKDFSKGMKRQAFIILALAIAPKYLLLDEAFDGLDPVMRLTFKRAISKMIEEKDMTIIISSHNLRELEDICDTFGILEEHTISTHGNIDDAREQIHKLQLAFSETKTLEDFKKLDIMSAKIQSRVVTLVVKGDLEQIEAYVKAMEPLMIEVLPVNLEEVFLYEMERKGYGVHE